MRYQPPEMLAMENESAKPTFAVDIYAFGMICYEVFLCFLNLTYGLNNSKFLDVFGKHRISQSPC